MRGCFALLLIVLLAQTTAAAEEREGRFSLEPIVVTARKMESDLQTVPISLSAVSGRNIVFGQTIRY